MLFLIGGIISYFRRKILYCLGKYNSKIVNNKGSGVINGEVKLGYPKNIYIGNNSYVNGGHLIASPNAKIVIGDNCLISYNVHLRTDMHNYLVKNKSINKQGCFEKDIIIGDDVWIGYGAQIMCGVVIGQGAVIAAGAIVTRNVESYSVVAGVPAKKIKDRI